MRTTFCLYFNQAALLLFRRGSNTHSAHNYQHSSRTQIIFYFFLFLYEINISPKKRRCHSSSPLSLLPAFTIRGTTRRAPLSLLLTSSFSRMVTESSRPELIWLVASFCALPFVRIKTVKLAMHQFNLTS